MVAPSCGFSSNQSSGDRTVDSDLSRDMRTRKWNSNRICSVPQCTNRTVVGEISLHKFPKNKKLRALWAVKLRIGKEVSDNMVACSEHFKKEDYFWSHLGKLSLCVASYDIHCLVFVYLKISALCDDD